MDAREKGICFGVTEFYNKEFEACKTCKRAEACYDSIFCFNFEAETKVEPEAPKKTKPITNEEKPLWQRVAPRLRIAEVDWEPVVNAIIKERPVLKKDASAIIKALIGGVIEGKVAPTAVYGYAGTIIYFLGVEGLLEWDGTAKGAINWK